MTGGPIVDYRILQISEYMNKQEKSGVLHCKMSFPTYFDRNFMLIIYDNSSSYISNVRVSEKGHLQFLMG